MFDGPGGADALECGYPSWMDADHLDDYFDDYRDEPPGFAGDLAELAARPVGPWLVTGLANLDRSSLSADERLTVAQLVEQVAAWAAGMQATVVAEAFDALIEHAAVAQPADDGEAGRVRFVSAELAAVAELAAALRVAPRTADRRVQQAVDLAGPTRPLRDAMLAGVVSAAHAAAVGRELEKLPSAGNPALAEVFAAQCGRVLAVVVPFAQTHTPGESARKARMLVAAVDPAGVRERRREITERQHGVFLQPTEAGTCEITAVMPLAHGQAVMSAVNALAAHEGFEVADGCVTAGQRRVAALVALMLGDPGSVGRVDGPVAEAKITAHINVVVPLATIHGTGSQGGTIAGQPVTADALQEFLADASTASTLRRLVVDGTGCIIDAGRTRYQISDAQRRLIELRDQHCRFPGCTQRAERCDIDHATPWNQGGRTDTCNLGPLCRRHHQLKTHAGWQITNSHPNGTCTWQTPLGRIYHHTPPDLLPPPPTPPDDGPPPDDDDPGF